VSPLGIRSQLRRNRRRLPLIAVMAAIGVALAAHHAGPALGELHHHDGSTAMAELCLAAFTAAGTAAVVLAIGLLALGRWRPPLTLRAGGVAVRRAPAPSARAGPSVLCLLCVSRR
jgi:hypothetical protein